MAYTLQHFWKKKKKVFAVKFIHLQKRCNLFKKRVNCLVFLFVKIYYSELLKLKDKIMKKFTILCKYIHIYIH